MATPHNRDWKTPELIIGIGGLVVAAIFGFAQCSRPAATVPPVSPPIQSVAPQATSAPVTTAAAETAATSGASAVPTGSDAPVAVPALTRTCTFTSRGKQAIDLDTCRTIPFEGGDPPLGIDLKLNRYGQLETSNSQTHGLATILDPDIQTCQTAIRGKSSFEDTLSNSDNELFQGSIFCMVTGDGTTAVVTVTKATPTTDNSFDGGISLKADLYR